MSEAARGKRPPVKRAARKRSPSTALRERAAALSGKWPSARAGGATGEILRLVAESPSDLRAVLDGILAGAIRLVGAELGGHGAIRWLAVPPGRSAGGDARVHGDGGQALPLRVRSRCAIDAGDHRASSRVHRGRLRCGLSGHPRTGAGGAVPEPALPPSAPRRPGDRHHQPRVVGHRPFPAERMAALRSFADQAVIAIENVRLFTELEARNADLTEAAGAADRDQRGAPRDQRLADRRAAGARHHRAERDPGLRGAGWLGPPEGRRRSPPGRPPRSACYWRGRGPCAHRPGLGIRRAVVDGCAIQVEDLLAAGGDYRVAWRWLDATDTGPRSRPRSSARKNPSGYCSSAGQGTRFSPKQMALLETFAARR